METRINLINKVIAYQNISDKVFSEILSYKWDYDGQPAILSPKDIVHALNLYLDNKISSDDVSQWADFLECRDDVLVHKSVEDILYELANPETEGYLTKDYIQTILNKL